VCSDIAPVLENAAGGGCLVVAGNGLSAWVEALRRVLTDDAYYSELRGAACRRELPTWGAAAGELAGQLAGARGLQS
jgi:hypothetical protein